MFGETGKTLANFPNLNSVNMVENRVYTIGDVILPMNSVKRAKSKFYGYKERKKMQFLRYVTMNERSPVNFTMIGRDEDKRSKEKQQLIYLIS